MGMIRGKRYKCKLGNCSMIIAIRQIHLERYHDDIVNPSLARKAWIDDNEEFFSDYFEDAAKDEELSSISKKGYVK